jgi:hypothetical protein
MFIDTTACPRCKKPVDHWLPLEPFFDGRELRELIGWSKDRWQGHWTPVFPAYFQYKHTRGSVKPRLIRVFPASQVRAFMDSGVWLAPAKRRTT